MTDKNIKFEGQLNPERFGNFEDWQKYKDGGHSIIYMADDSDTGNKVAIKRHLHYMPERVGEEQAIRDAKTRYEREIAMLGRLSHPGIVQSQGYFFRTEHGIPVPYLVMEPLETDTIEDKLATGQPVSEQEAREAILSVGTVLDYLHTANGRPIIYRDLKPGNVKEMPKNAPWPHKVVDFSESRIGNATMSGSVMGTIGYNDPQIYGGGIADKTTDFYSLLRIASHMLIGDNKKFMDTYFGKATLRGMKDVGDLNVSEELLSAIEKGTDITPDGRYRTLVELANDIGYKINRVPQTRQELEAILGKSGLPVAIQTPKQEPEERAGVANVDSGLPDVVDNKKRVIDLASSSDSQGLLVIGGYVFKVGNSDYETLRNVRGSDRAKNYPEYLYATLEHLSRHNSLLAQALDGKTTLESLVREKKPKYDSPPKEKFSFYRREAFELEKQDYAQRRSQLCKMLGVDEKELKLVNDGYWKGGTIGSIGALASIGIDNPMAIFLVPSPVLGAIAGSQIGKYRAKRKLEKRAREIDGWVREARVAQGLEKKVEEVYLRQGEMWSIYGKSLLYGTLPGSFVGTGLVDLLGNLVNIPYQELTSVAVGVSLSVLSGVYSMAYLKNKKLLEKRLAAGLPAEETKKEKKIIGYGNDLDNIVERLSENGFKKRIFRKKFVNGEGVEVSYKYSHYSFFEKGQPVYEFTIRAMDEDRIEYTSNVINVRGMAPERLKISGAVPSLNPPSVSVEDDHLKDELIGKRRISRHRGYP